MKCSKESARAAKPQSPSLRQLVPSIGNEFGRTQDFEALLRHLHEQRLPVEAIRRILWALVSKEGASARRAKRPAHCKDLLFVSSFDENDHRRITISLLRTEGDSKPRLETFSWDERETPSYPLERMPMDQSQSPSGASASHYREQIRTAQESCETSATLAARTRSLTLDLLRCIGNISSRAGRSEA